MYESKAKIYRYTLWKALLQSLSCSFCLECAPKHRFFSTLEKNLQEFCGEHDFSSFCSIDSSAKTKVREVFDIKLVDHGGSCDIWFLGKGFLKQMIRIMVGTVVELGLGKLSAKNIFRIIEAKDREKAGITAPGQGLFLMQVFFSSQLPKRFYFISR